MRLTSPARKRFGQNFLHDERVIQRMISAISPKSGEHFVEIGPGYGALTTKLLPALGTLDVVELDRDLVPILVAACEGLGCLNVHQADALRFDFAQLVLDDHRPLRIVGNLPYNISTPLLFHLLTNASLIQDMHFMLQKEVVQRMAAKPSTSAYGRLSVMVQYYCQVESLFKVPASAFTPAPKVESAVVRLQPHKELPFPCKDVAHFANVVQHAFGQRRKTLRNSLKSLFSEEALTALGLDPKARAENLTVENYVRLANALL